MTVGQSLIGLESCEQSDKSRVGVQWQYGRDVLSEVERKGRL